MNSNFLMTAQRLENLNVAIERKELILSSADKVTTFGSCFAQNLNAWLNDYGLDSLFERSICAHYSTTTLVQTLTRLAAKRAVPEAELYCFEDELGGVLPTTYFAKNRIFGDDPKRVALEKYGARDKVVYDHIKRSRLITVTLGTARVVRMKSTGMCICSVSGIPKSEYEFELTDVETNVKNLHAVYDSIVAIKGSTDFQMLITLSPQRYKWSNVYLEGKCGFVDNSLNKAILRVAIEQFVESYSNVTYYPAYEIVIDELRQYETLSGYDYLHVNRNTTPKYVVKRFFLSYASEDVVNQLPLLDDLHMLLHTFAKDVAHNADLKAPYYRRKVQKFIKEAEDVIGDAQWNMLLSDRLYGAAVRTGIPEAFMKFWTILQSRLADKHSSFMIWGVGGRYKEYFSSFVRSGEFLMDFKGLVDSNPAAIGTQVDGHLVRSPEEIAQIKPDLILSASTFHDQIVKQAKRIYPEALVRYYGF